MGPGCLYILSESKMNNHNITCLKAICEMGSHADSWKRGRFRINNLEATCSVCVPKKQTNGNWLSFVRRNHVIGPVSWYFRHHQLGLCADRQTRGRPICRSDLSALLQRKYIDIETVSLYVFIWLYIKTKIIFYFMKYSRRFHIALSTIHRRANACLVYVSPQYLAN